MPDSISVVIPVYNSEQTLDKLVEKLISVLTASWDQYEIILVDDGSRDNSFLKMRELHDKYCNVKVIRLEKNFGQQNAVICGLNYARGDYMVTMDDDLQNPPEEIQTLVSKMREGFDVVYGIPLIKRHSGFRNFGTFLTDCLFRLIFGKPGNIKISSFRVIKGDLVKKIIIEKTSFVYISAIILKNTSRIGNVTVRHSEREYGHSNYKLYKLVKLYLNLLVNYTPLGCIFRTSARPQYKIKDLQL